MKNKYLLSLLIIIFSSTLSFSQTNYKNGFIITQANDTVYGEIDIRKDKILNRTCRFKKEDHKTTYSPFEIKAYRLTDGRFFMSRTIDGKNVFLEILIKGKLSVFGLSDFDNFTHYYVENELGELREIPYLEKYINVDGKKYLKTSKDHVGFLSLYTSDAPKLQTKIKAIEKPSRRNLIKLAKTYHNMVCDTDECIVYETKSRKFTFLAELSFGVKSFTKKIYNYNSITSNNYFTKRALVHVLIPSLGDEWFAKVGIITTDIDFIEFNHFDESTLTPETIYEFPLQMEYMRSKGLVRPNFSFGVKPGKVSLMSAGVGLNVRLLKDLFFSMNSDFDFKNELDAVNYTGGITYQF